MKPAKQKCLQHLFHGASNETDTWLDFARDCNYISVEDHARLIQQCKQNGSMIGSMLKTAPSFTTDH